MQMLAHRSLRSVYVGIKPIKAKTSLASYFTLLRLLLGL